MEKVVASIMCADQLNLAEELTKLKEAGITWLHCDVMDGQFVNNLAMGPYVLSPIIKSGDFTTDVHLACVEPEKYIEMFAKISPDYLTFHVETTTDVERLIDKIHAYGIKAGIAVSPKTPIEEIYPYLEKLELVLMMTVEPGFAGQAFQRPVLEKIKQLNQQFVTMENPPLVEVDGNINRETVKEISPLGANLYVVGTSALFNNTAESYREKVQQVSSSFTTN